MVARHQAARPAGRPASPPRGSVLLAEGKEEGKEEGRSFSLPSFSLTSLLPVAFGFVAFQVNLNPNPNSGRGRCNRFLRSCTRTRRSCSPHLCTAKYPDR